MLIVVVGFATILMAIWLLLLGMVSNEDWVAAARNKVLDNRQQIDKRKQTAAIPWRCSKGYGHLLRRNIGKRNCQIREAE